MSTDSMAGHQSIDMSRGSLPPDCGSINIEMFTPPTGIVTPSSVNQFVTSSGPPVTMQLDAALVMSRLSREQAEEIFILTYKAQTLGRKLTHKFILLSHKEALFHMGIQATAYEQASSGCPHHVTVYYSMIKSEGGGVSPEKFDETIEHLWKEAGKAWLNMNQMLFHHALDYQGKMSDLLTESSQSIEVLHDQIWTVVLKVMEDAGKPMADGLGITMHLVDMLPTIPLDLAFKSAVPALTGFASEVYAAWPKSRMDLLDFCHTPPPQSDWRVLHVLCEEIPRSAHGPTDKVKAIQPSLLWSVANVSTIGVKAAEAGAGNGPSTSQCTSYSLVACTSHSPVAHASCSPV